MESYLDMVLRRLRELRAMSASKYMTTWYDPYVMVLVWIGVLLIVALGAVLLVVIKAADLAARAIICSAAAFFTVLYLWNHFIYPIAPPPLPMERAMSMQQCIEVGGSSWFNDRGTWAGCFKIELPRPLSPDWEGMRWRKHNVEEAQ